MSDLGFPYTWTSSNAKDRPCHCCYNLKQLFCTKGACIDCHNMGLCHHD